MQIAVFAKLGGRLYYYPSFDFILLITPLTLSFLHHYVLCLQPADLSIFSTLPPTAVSLISLVASNSTNLLTISSEVEERKLDRVKKKLTIFLSILFHER